VAFISTEQQPVELQLSIQMKPTTTPNNNNECFK
jgi:hypothetical protein